MYYCYGFYKKIVKRTENFEARKKKNSVPFCRLVLWVARQKATHQKKETIEI